jgi:glycosyltransferase involved in cell wall biosynthesis
MKVLLQSRYQYPLVESGGLGIVVYELMKALPPLCEKVEHWTWRSRTSKYEEDVKGMVGYDRISDIDVSDPQLSLLFDLELTNLSMIRDYDRKALDFDILHAHTWEVYLAAVIAKFTKGLPLVYTTHDIMQNDAHDELNRTSDIYSYGVMCERIMMSEADRIIAVSEDNRNALLEFYPEVAPKTVVIPNGVDIANFHPDAGMPTQLDLDEPYMLFIGRAVPSKGIDAIIEMLEHLPDSVPMVFAVSTRRWDSEAHPNADSYVDKIQDLAKRRPRTKLLINEWRRDIVAGLYANAMLTIAPSTYEPCGMVTMESQACATPVVTNSIGFMKTSVRDGVDGLLIPAKPDDPDYPKAMAHSVARLIDDPDLRAEMGRRGRENVERAHSWAERARQHVALYSELVEGSSP